VPVTTAAVHFVAGLQVVRKIHKATPRRDDRQFIACSGLAACQPQAMGDRRMNRYRVKPASILSATRQTQPMIRYVGARTDVPQSGLATALARLLAGSWGRSRLSVLPHVPANAGAEGAKRSVRITQARI
jgi:hypothetical protein